MLKITRTTDRDSVPTLKLEGKLLGPWVEELRQACARPAGGVRLDLSAVSFVDGEGARLLRELARRGIPLAACSAFVAELLHGEQP